jgi:Arm DNA-binding domain
MATLTDTVIRTTKPSEKPQKLFDGGGLYLLIKPTGTRLWHLKYRVAGREKLICFGQYPDVSLKQAREQRDEARKLIAAKVDPSAKRKAERAAQSDTFEAITREWLDVKAQGIDERTRAKRLARFETFVFPLIGSGRSLPSPRPTSCLFSSASRLAARMRRPTVCAQSRGRSFAMPSRPGAPSATPPPTLGCPRTRRCA